MKHYVHNMVKTGVQKQVLMKPHLQKIAKELKTEFHDHDDKPYHPYDYAIGRCRIEIETHIKPFWTDDFRAQVIEAKKWPRGISIPLRRFNDKKDIWIKQSHTGESFIAADLTVLKKDAVFSDHTDKIWAAQRYDRPENTRGNSFYEVSFDRIDGIVVLCDCYVKLTELIRKFV